MENFEIQEAIGQGSFSKVFKVVRKSDQKVFVSKQMQFGKMSEKEKQQLVSEVNILRELKHHNIVKYYDRIIDKQSQNIFIIMEYCEGGDLAQFLKKLRKQKEDFPEEAIWKISSQIILALFEIHQRKEGKILHRDIKPANIFLDGQSNVKLGDFGLAKMLVQEEYAETQVGTPYYMSPELINEHRYNDKSDIWAFGCLLYEICSLCPPFQAQNYLSLAMKIKSGTFQRIPSRYSDEMQRVITWCLQRSDADRPSVDDLINLPQVSLRLREKRLRENLQIIVRREESNQKKEEQLKDIESRLKQKEKDIQKLLNSMIINGENKENVKPELITQSYNLKKDSYLIIHPIKTEGSELDTQFFQY